MTLDEAKLDEIERRANHWTIRDGGIMVGIEELRSLLSLARIGLRGQGGEMLECAAKALFENGPRDRRPAAIWELLTDDWKEAFRTSAKVVIDAIRDPRDPT